MSQNSLLKELGLLANMIRKTDSMAHDTQQDREKILMRFIASVTCKMFDNKGNEKLTPKLKVKCETCCIYVDLDSSGTFTAVKVNRDPYDPITTQYFSGKDSWDDLTKYIAKYDVYSFTVGYY